jgi:hypothetical protein
MTGDIRLALSQGVGGRVSPVGRDTQSVTWQAISVTPTMNSAWKLSAGR